MEIWYINNTIFQYYEQYRYIDRLYISRTHMGLSCTPYSLPDIFMYNK